MNRNILVWLESSAEKYPTNIAFGDVKEEVTYTDLKNRARIIGSFLAERVKPCSPVAFYLEKSCLAMCGMLGAVYVRGFYSVLDIRQPHTRTEKTLDVLKPAVILTDRTNFENALTFAEKAPVFCLEDILQQGVVCEDKLQNIRRTAMDTDPLYVNFTSGSTGTPKGVTVCHRSVIDFIECFVSTFQIRESDVIGNQAPFDFDVSVKDIYSAMMTGARVQIIPREFFSAPISLMDYLFAHQVTVLIWAVSAMCFVSIMNGLSYKVPEKVRMIMFSGEVMPIKHLKVWQKYLPDALYVNLYGPTEITCNCTYHILERVYEDTETIPAGVPFENEKVFLLDEHDREVIQSGTEGEICVSGTCLALGYYNDPERTAQAFMQNPLNPFYHERMYRTGDIGKYDAAGKLVYVSRKDFQIKHLGHRIELGEIEMAAMSGNGVTRACCIYDTVKKRIILFCTGICDGKELLKELRESLPPFMLPNSVHMLDEMPLNKNGKIDRKQLMDIYLDGKK
ncbi:MAG: amino acid adenylation domain-containing protein [Butyrivibrio sp.]|nr:amino acid adenylation domain-containing protein [Butyrivibrio sp.]